MKKFALVGNPNCGKTTLFNTLTGSSARTGNFPGITIDKKVGTYKKLEEKISIIDLPGIYSLSPYTPEEIVSRNVILDDKPDCIINIIDATNLERNLYLTTQLLEIDVPIVICLNMCDVLRKGGDKINPSLLEERLGIKVIEASALKGEHVDDLMKIAYEESKKERKGKVVYDSSEISTLIQNVNIAFSGQKIPDPLFHAIKLIEADEIETKNHPDLVSMVDQFKSTFNNEIFGDDFEALIADARYRTITKDFSNIIIRSKKYRPNQLSKSDKIDKVLTHKIWAIPILLLIMFLIFHFTFSSDLFFMGAMGLKFNNKIVINIFTGLNYQDGTIMSGIPSPGVFLKNWMSCGTRNLTNLFVNIFTNYNVRDTWYASLVCDGLFKGLDAILSFLPQLLLLFFFIAILEDSGYMARIAFILDRAFRKFGLSGKAFIPMLTGFGCSVPAILATRTLQNEKEKNRTIRLITCFSCGAKAPVWTLLATLGVLGGFKGDLFVFSIYLGGIALAIILAIFMKVLDRKPYTSPFIMELPNYHRPQGRNVGALLWEKAKHFLKKAFTVIAICLLVIWFLESFGIENNKFAFVSNVEFSFLSYIGKALQYIFYPCGWAIGQDGWKYTVSSITGVVAKENIVGTMAIFFGSDGKGIGLTSYGVFSFALFNLLTVPCIAAISAAKGEQTKKEFLLTLLFWFLLGYITSAVIFWMGKLFELNILFGGLTLSLLILIIILSAILVSKKEKKKLKSI